MSGRGPVDLIPDFAGEPMTPAAMVAAIAASVGHIDGGAPAFPLGLWEFGPDQDRGRLLWLWKGSDAMCRARDQWADRLEAMGWRVRRLEVYVWNGGPRRLALFGIPPR